MLLRTRFITKLINRSWGLSWRFIIFWFLSGMSVLLKNGRQMGRETLGEKILQPTISGCEERRKGGCGWIAVTRMEKRIARLVAGSCKANVGVEGLNARQTHKQDGKKKLLSTPAKLEVQCSFPGVNSAYLYVDQKDVLVVFYISPLLLSVRHYAYILHVCL